MDELVDRYFDALAKAREKQVLKETPEASLMHELRSIEVDAQTSGTKLGLHVAGMAGAAAAYLEFLASAEEGPGG